MTKTLNFRAWRAAAIAIVLAGISAPAARAQDTAAEEAAHRAAVLAQLPANAAKRVFGLAEEPVAGSPNSIGSYTKGCIAGAVQLPADGPNWQVMRPSRNRAWGHPQLIAFIERLATAMPQINGWPGLLIGDLAQPRGGPMLTGHASHQLGIEADIWLTPMPDRRLNREERDAMLATNVVAANRLDVDPAVWSPAYRQLLEAVARRPEVARIFVNPAIKRALCREAGADRAWLSRIRPWWGHNYHFHIRLSCPAGDTACEGQPPPAAEDGCGKELDWWFTSEALHPPPPSPRVTSPRIADLPRACAGIVSRK
jgi:penicillin-insensitive murein DD-endopeptidase